MSTPTVTRPPRRALALQYLGGFIFWTRWLQAPLYLGLIVAQAVYVWYFLVELTPFAN